MNLSKLYLAVLSSSFVITSVVAEVEVTGKLTHEHAVFTKDGTTIGASRAHKEGDIFKSETSARVYIDGEIDNQFISSTPYHIEIQGFNDGEAVGEMDGNDSFTQRDPLREAYVDKSIGDWNLRLGKQQVVWGTADGYKLLDNINPTDYSEMAQNQIEDSRIPVWMANFEKPLEDGGNFQFIISQPRENIFAGLDRNISTAERKNSTAVGTSAVMDTSDNSLHQAGASQNNPFILKGVDSMTGKANGFLNIVPDLGSIAQRFYNEFSATGGGTLQNSTTTVGWFAEASASTIYTSFGPYYSTIGLFSNPSGLNYDGTQILGGFAGAYDTNLINANSRYSWKSNPDSTFEFMPNATFGTFDAFANAKSRWVYDMPSDADADIAMKYSNTTNDGTNFSLNYSYAYDKNPIVNMSWQNDSNEKLTQNYSHSGGTTTISLTDSRNGRYGAWGSSGGGTSAGPATLVFEETVERAHTIGGSFDTTFDTASLGPIVLRGEAAYLKDVYTPVINKAALSIGDLPNALTMHKGDRFKYVLGVDITALTNMMVSAQFIQDRNLDFVDTTASISGNSSITGDKYTVDYATMSLTNDFQKGEENDNFVSLYLSKPFGASGQHRWNNITMREEGGGKWNRFDVEYTINDSTIGTVEWNRYWGHPNTQFGQLDKASNVQLGVKYLF